MKYLGEHKTNSPEETEELGYRLSGTLDQGAVLAFVGELGSGKTTMIRGIACGLGVDVREVASPTFSIAHIYFARLPVYHIDLFRIEKYSEIEELGLLELIDGDGVSLIEWAERFPQLVPDKAIWVLMSRCWESERKITITEERPVFDE